MRKNISALLIFLFVSVVMLTGCGSSSNDGTLPMILPSSSADPSSPTDPTSPPSEVSGYAFDNATTPMEITQANKDYTLKVQLLNDGFVAVGETVQLRAFSALYGDVASYSVTTGADGYANFDYTSHYSRNSIGFSISGRWWSIQFDQRNDAHID